MADCLIAIDPSFNKKHFNDLIFSNGFHDMEWKQRVKHTTSVLHQFMPSDFPKAAMQIEKLISLLKERNIRGGLEFVIFPDYIETYGLDDFETSAKAFELITQFITCEFAVRPFVIKYGDRMIQQMNVWSLHENSQVRRLASEGSRPRLPWAMAIPDLKKDPAPLLAILNNLKNDPSESVRRSVANNLNDIAKDHPEVVIKIAMEWQGLSKETDAIIKHGSRTLLKQGHVTILKHYGLDSVGFVVTDFTIVTPVIKIGDNVQFFFHVQNTNKKACVLRMEYGIYYQKAKGHLARKVFKISERTYQPGEAVKVERKQSFKLITTRKFHVGQHKISIIINGQEMLEKYFELIP